MQRDAAGAKRAGAVLARPGIALPGKSLGDVKRFRLLTGADQGLSRAGYAAGRGGSMTMVSYAQNGEDVMLMRALGNVAHGFYIDVGAADPTSVSVTRAFYDRGWHGVNVEPTPEHHRRLVEARARDVNLSQPLSDHAAEKLFYFCDHPDLSTLVGDVAAAAATDGRKTESRLVQTTTLADVCRRFAPPVIHFLKIDVEGAEESVLRGADFTRYRPWIVVVEATRPNTQISTHANWEPILIDAGYRFAWFDGLNRFYLAAERFDTLRHHFDVSINVFDNYVRYDPGVEALSTELAAVRAQVEPSREAAAAAQAHTEALERERSDVLRRSNATVALLDARMRSADTMAQAAALNAQAAETQVGAAKARLGDLQREIAETRRRHDEIHAREEARHEVQVAREAEATARYALLHHELEDTAAEREQLRQERDALVRAQQALAAESAGREARIEALEHEIARLRKPEPTAAPAGVVVAPVFRAKLRWRVAMRLYRWSLRPLARPLAWRTRSFLLSGIRQVLAESVGQPGKEIVPLLQRQAEAIGHLRSRQDRTLDMVHRVDDGCAELRARQEARFLEIRIIAERDVETTRRIETALQAHGTGNNDALRLAASMEDALLTLATAGRGRVLQALEIDRS